MATDHNASALIDRKIAEIGGWRSDAMERMRRLIHEADPEVEEAVKWRKPNNPWGVPVWEHAGMICTGETYKKYIKLTFARGASLDDPAKLFNASLSGGTRRAIDIREGDMIDGEAFKALVREAIAVNVAKAKR